MTKKNPEITHFLTTDQTYYIANLIDEDLEIDAIRHILSPQARAYAERISLKLRKAMAEQLDS